MCLHCQVSVCVFKPTEEQISIKQPHKIQAGLYVKILHCHPALSP